MRLDLYGGFGEKGRTCLGVESAGFRVLLDAGVKTSARRRPRLLSGHRSGRAPRHRRDRPDACARRSYRRTRLVHRERLSRTDLHDAPKRGARPDACLASYATPEEHALVRAGGRGAIAGRRRCARRSGRCASRPAARATWAAACGATSMTAACASTTAATSFPRARCSRWIPSRAATRSSSMPRTATTTRRVRERAVEIAAWVAAHPQGSVLPTPLYGRSAELLALVDGPVALAPGMRDALRTQAEGHAWLVPGWRRALAARLAAQRRLAHRRAFAPRRPSLP